MASPSPRPLSAIMPSVMESLKDKCASGSPEETEQKKAQRLAWTRDSLHADLDAIKRTFELDVRIPARFVERAKFENLGWIKNKKAVSHCEAFTKDPAKTAPPMLMGQTGSGKTHLIWATVGALVEAVRTEVAEFALQGMRTICEKMADGGDFVAVKDALKWPTHVHLVVATGADLAHAMRQSVARNGIESVVARHAQKDKLDRGTNVLVIDDIEVMKMGDWLNEELYRIFDFRYAELHPTMVVTNLAPTELKAHLGDRITRRIMDMTEPFELKR